MKVEIYSDVACPWCYIGKARFERALGAFAGAAGVDVVFRPYQLDPATPRAAVPMFQYLEQRFGPGAGGMVARVADTARQEGLTMDFEHGLAANTFDAHRLMWLAEREHGADVQRALGERLFRAHFAEGRDIGDAEALAELAAAAGMDASRARAFLGTDEGTDEVRRQVAEAQEMGITAVPTFVFDDRYAVQGAQPTSAFLQVLEQVAAEAQATGAEAAPDAAASCANGACEA
ncbi:MAG TPA: DsbA family oxidoreductase [Gemmatimonadaceae bacterium]